MNTKVKSFLILSLISLTSILMLSQIKAVVGQWSTNSSTIFYNDGSIGLGTNTPLQPLQIFSSTTNKGLALIGNGVGSLELIGAIGTDSKGYNNISTNAYIGTSGWQKRTNNYESWIQSNFVTNNNTGYYTIFHSDPQSGAITNLKSVFEINSLGDTTFSRGNGSTLSIQSPATDVRLVTNNKPLLIGATRVGIGTNNPSERLSVNGKILAKEILVTNSATDWADYVFEDDYKLAPLSEVDQFIKENKHLPNIPSASEIAKNGIALGEIQKLQMEKIEELTLYLIETEEEIARIEKKLSALESLVK